MKMDWFAPRCSTVRANLVAWIDGGLSARSMRRMQAHLDRCRSCAAEAASLRAETAVQRDRLRSLLLTERIDVDRLWQQLDRRLRATVRQPRPRRSAVWLWRPALAFAVASGLLWVGSTAFDGPAAVLISVGVKAPPAKLTQHPDLFKDYAIIQDLDVLEHFDTAGVDSPDEGVTPAANQG
ncbi:MAG TPA: zf-HC2 domain-containing protein [Candidatus Kryptonia bacterium]|nr:zf-HC2 domain-containing protein [Candidatus Kryptonia bacterium]